MPVCPLCSQPVPVNRGEDPNAKVSDRLNNIFLQAKEATFLLNREQSYSASGGHAHTE